MKIKLLIILIIISFLISIGCTQPQIIPTDFNSTSTSIISTIPTATESKIREVKLADSIKEAAIEDCKNKTDWGIDLITISANYHVGVKLSAWIILHNGDNEDRMVTISFLPTTKPIVESATNRVYKPTPSNVKMEYVTIGEKNIRLTRMETKAVEVSLLVPDGVGIGNDNWAFYINADSQPIFDYKQTASVITEDNDNGILELKLDNRLLNNDLASISNISSSIGENLIATSYNKRDNILIIEGLKKEALTRDVTVKYEGVSLFTFACNQIWLLTML